MKSNIDKPLFTNRYQVEFQGNVSLCEGFEVLGGAGGTEGGEYYQGVVGSCDD